MNEQNQIPESIEDEKKAKIRKEDLRQFIKHKKAELDWFRKQSTLRDAIHYITFAINEKGKRYTIE